MDVPALALEEVEPKDDNDNDNVEMTPETADAVMAARILYQYMLTG
jgi:hypothetical protein